MKLIRWSQKNHDPFKELFDLGYPGAALFPNVEKYLNNAGQEAWFPAVDISEDKENILIKADLPGLDKENVTLNIDEDVLTIRGERKSETESKEKNYHRIERSYGTFERSFKLGAKIDETKIKAVYKDGVLDITLPKSEKSAAKQITIEGK